VNARAVLPTALLLLGCDYGGSEGSGAVESCGEAGSADVDTGAEIELTPGEGVGLFVEHLSEGEWRLSTTCDTLISGATCYWDVLVYPTADGVLGDFSSLGFEDGDAVGFSYGGWLHFIADTTDNADGLLVTATPGEALSFEAYLDGYCASPYMFWIGDGAVHAGAPGNPLELTPSE
jgi:hypothetical protein